MALQTTISFGLYFSTLSFTSLVTVFHHVDPMVWRANLLGCMPLSKWVCGKPQSTKSVTEEYELLEEELFEAGITPYEVWSDTSNIIKDIGMTFAVWMTGDARIDFTYLTRTYLQSPELVTLQNLVKYYSQSTLLFVYAKDNHYNVTYVEYNLNNTVIKTLSSYNVSRSTLLTPPILSLSPEHNDIDLEELIIPLSPEREEIESNLID